MYRPQVHQWWIQDLIEYDDGGGGPVPSPEFRESLSIRNVSLRPFGELS